MSNEAELTCPRRANAWIEELTKRVPHLITCRDLLDSREDKATINAELVKVRKSISVLTTLVDKVERLDNDIASLAVTLAHLKRKTSKLQPLQDLGINKDEYDKVSTAAISVSDLFESKKAERKKLMERINEHK